MINTTKFKQLLKTYEMFPWLRDTITTHSVMTAFNLNDLLDDTFYDIYFGETDIYSIKEYNAIAQENHNWWRRSLSSDSFHEEIDDLKEQAAIVKEKDQKKFFQMNLFRYILEKYSYLRDSNMDLLEFSKNFLIKNIQLFNSFNFNFKEENFKHEKYSYKTALYLLYDTENRVSNSFILSYLLKTSTSDYSFTDFIQKFSSDEIKLVEEFYTTFSDCEKDLKEHEYEKLFKEIYPCVSFEGFSSISHTYCEETKKHINNFSLSHPTDEINKLQNNYLNKLDYYFRRYNITYNRTISLLNLALTEDEQTALLAKVKKADDVKNIIATLKENRNINFERLDFLFDKCVLNNPKIRDNKFPKTKDKVLCEVIKSIFINNSAFSIYSESILDAESMEKLINKYYKYFYNPYFITMLFDNASVFNGTYRNNTRETKKYFDLLFRKKFVNNIKYFIREYIREIQKDEKDRKNPFPTKVYSSILTYGTLEFFIYKYILNIYIISPDQSKLSNLKEFMTNFILKDLILQDNDLKKFDLIIFYITTVYSYDLLYQDIGIFDSKINKKSSYLYPYSFDQNISLFRRLITNFHFSGFMPTCSSSMNYVPFHNTSEQNSATLILNILDDTRNLYDSDFLRKTIGSIIADTNMCSYYGSSKLKVISADHMPIIKNAFQYVILEYLDIANKLFNDNSPIQGVNRKIYIDFEKELKSKLFANDDNKCIIKPKTSYYYSKKENDSKIRYDYYNFLDFDTIFKIQDFKKLNKEYNLYDIEIDLEDTILIPNLYSINYPVESDPNAKNRYAWRDTISIKYNENTTSKKIYDLILNLDEDIKKAIFNNCIKSYSEDDFKFDTEVNEAITNICEIESELAEDNKYNLQSRYSPSYKYVVFSKIDDKSEQLINNSFMDTLVQSYHDLFDVLGYNSNPEISNFYSKLDQAATNYNCLKTLTK